MISFSTLGKYGRLGNQLFQVAATIAAAKRFGTEAKFPKWEYARFFKGFFDQTLDPEQIETTFVQSFSHYTPIPNNSDQDLVGYFQSDKYFSDCERYVRQQFQFIDDLLPDHWHNSHFDCSVHIRRGDYTVAPHVYTNLGLDYYKRAIQRARKHGAESLLVFSDDIDWCKRNLDKSFSFVDGLSDIQSLCLLSKCTNHIIANSSFSWWGSWLSPHPEKLIIAPTKWFGLVPSFLYSWSAKDIYCDNWQLIDHDGNIFRSIYCLAEDALKHPERYEKIFSIRAMGRRDRCYHLASCLGLF